MNDQENQEKLGDSSIRDLEDIKSGAQNARAVAEKAKKVHQSYKAASAGKASTGAVAPSAASGGAVSTGGAAGGVAGGTASGAAGTATGAATGATAGTATVTAAGSAAAAGGGAAAGATTGAAAGSAVAGPIGTLAGTLIGAVAKPIAKTIIVSIIACVFLVTAVIYSLPSMIFGTNGSALNSYGTETLSIQDAAIGVITDAYADVFNTIVDKANNGGYDVDLTLDNLVDMSGGATNVDIAYLISAYSVSMKNKDTSSADMIAKLKAKAGELYSFTSTVMVGEKTVPATVDVYEPITITIPQTVYTTTKVYYVRKLQTPFTNETGLYLPTYEERQVSVIHANGSITNEKYYEKTGTAFYQYPTTKNIYVYAPVTVTSPANPSTKEETVYRKIGTQEIGEKTTLPAYEEKEFTVLDSAGNQTTQTYFVEAGTQEISPEVVSVEYLQVTINPIAKSAINKAFDLDLNGWYSEPLGEFEDLGVKNSAAIEDMEENLIALMRDANISLYQSAGGGGIGGIPQEIPALTSLMDGLVIPACSDNRLYMMEIGSALVGRVPYWFGGNHGSNYCPPGWNADWIVTKRQVPAGDKAGQNLPYGIDCSGFVKWVYATAFGADQFTRDDYTGTFASSPNVRRISASELLPGDIALCDGHAGLFLGYNAQGQRVYMHALNYKKNIIVSTYSEFNVFLRVTSVEDQLEGDNLRKQADVLTRLGLSSAANPAVDYTLPEYSWMSTISNPLPTDTVSTQKELSVKYYCSCEACTGLPDKTTTSSGVEYAPGIAASNELPIGTKVGLFGKVFVVQDTIPNAEPGTIYLYVPQHSLLSYMKEKSVVVPIYQ